MMDDNYNKNDDDELNDFIEKLNQKFDDEPDLKGEVQFMIDRLAEIFENDVDINVKVNGKLEEYKQALVSYDVEEFNVKDSNTMKVGELLDILNDEDKNLDLTFDPIHLKEGINNTVNIYVTTFEDKLILVPVTNKK